MKKFRPIYKTWNLYTEAEQKDVMDLLKDDSDYKYSEAELYERAAEMVNIDYWNDDFDIKHGEVCYSPLADQEVLITGTLGLWNGRHKIQPVKADNILEAIQRCCGQDIDEVDMYEDSYGNFILDAYHHDGCNHFVIKKHTKKGNRCLHFIREVFGA